MNDNDPELRSARLNGALSNLQGRAMSLLSHERALLENEIAELEKRKQLALRRLKGYSNEMTSEKSDSNQHTWLSLPSDITTMRTRLQKSCTDEETLLTLVQEVRQKRSELLEEAIRIYASRDSHDTTISK